MRLQRYAREWILDLEDITEQHERLKDGQVDQLRTPLETVFVPADASVSRRLGLAAPP